MLSSAVLFASAIVTFSGYVPPHAASDGVRYEVATQRHSGSRAALEACGITDHALIRHDEVETVFKFAVTRATQAAVQCLRARLPQDARFEPIDSWTRDAQTH
jgi:hypothetical protein